MKKLIYCIYFSPDGNLPDSVYGGLQKWNKDINKEDNTEIVFITNTKMLSGEAIRHCEETGVMIRDYHEYSKQPSFKIVRELIEERTARAQKNERPLLLTMASDILRWLVISSVDEDTLTFYADINDNIPDFAQLNKLNIEFFKNNPWGFACQLHNANQYSDSPTVKVHMTNDVLITRRANNPQFFKALIDRYTWQIENILVVMDAFDELDEKLLLSTAFPAGFSREVKRQPLAESNSKYTPFTYRDRKGQTFSADIEQINSRQYVTVERQGQKGSSWKLHPNPLCQHEYTEAERGDATNVKVA